MKTVLTSSAAAVGAVLLMDWTFKRFKKFGTPTSDSEDPLTILKDIDGGVR